MSIRDERFGTRTNPPARMMDLAWLENAPSGMRD